MNWLRLIVFFFAVFPVASLSAESDADKLERIKGEVRQRRELREQAAGNAGAAYFPIGVSASWFAGPVTLDFEGDAIRSSGQLFATLTKKEVLISAAVAKRSFSLVAEAQTAREAERKLRAAYEQAGIKIIEVGDSILVLADAVSVK